MKQDNEIERYVDTEEFRNRKSTCGKERGMTKITCTCFDCKHCSENAECTANEIKLTSGNIATVWEGRQDVWWCKSFEMSEEAKDCYKRIAEILKGSGNDKHTDHNPS